MKLFFRRERQMPAERVDESAANQAVDPVIKTRRSPQDGHDMIEMDQLDEAARIFEDEARHAELGTKTLKLPDWFDFDLSPEWPKVRQQQLRLWEAITGRENYDPSANEDTPGVGELDAWRRPAFYAWG